MQTNSPPTLDTSKTMLTPPKQNILVFSTHIPTFHLNLPLFSQIDKDDSNKE